MWHVQITKTRTFVLVQSNGFGEKTCCFVKNCIYLVLISMRIKDNCFDEGPQTLPNNSQLNIYDTLSYRPTNMDQIEQIISTMNPTKKWNWPVRSFRSSIVWMYFLIWIFWILKIWSGFCFSSFLLNDKCKIVIFLEICIQQTKWIFVTG